MFSYCYNRSALFPIVPCAMPSFDRFSAQAAAYGRYRIDYSSALYAWLLS